MSVAFSHELAWYLAEGWAIASTAAYATPTDSDEGPDRVFLVTVQKGTEVRVLGYEHFLKVDADGEDDLDPSPYRASFVKNLSGIY